MPETLTVGRLVDRGTGFDGQRREPKLFVMGQVMSSPHHLAAGFGLLSVVDEDADNSCDQVNRTSQSIVARSADRGHDDEATREAATLKLLIQTI
jgi:hypothetical protein